MRRLEYKDAKSHKFWELDIEGDAYTVRYGKVGTDGQTQTKTCASPDKAAAEGNKKLASKLAKGYAEVAVDVATATQRAAAEATRNPALEQAIFDAPDDREAWQVYGDWLQQQNDPRGEIILLDLGAEQASGATQAKLEARRAELHVEHRKQLLGGLAKHLGDERIDEVATFEWERGYIVKAKVGCSEEDWEGPAIDSILRALVKSPAALFLRELWVGTSYDENEDWLGLLAKNLQAITKAGKLEALRALTVADTEDYWDISSTRVGDVTAALRVAPGLRTLAVVGGEIELDSLEHDHLESLSFKTGGLPGETAAALGRCKFPALTKMTVYFGAERYGASASLDDIAGVLAGAGLPKLRHLGLVDAEFQDEIAAALASSPILARLRSVDLSMGTMTDVGAQAILAAASQFAGLERLDLSDNFISAAAASELKAALPKVELAISSQRTPYEHGGRPHYYVSVGE